MVKTLYNKNRPLLDLEIEKGVCKKITNKYDENEQFLPLILWNDTTPKAFNTWLKKRMIPATRDGIGEVQKIYLKKVNFGGYFSLSDQYWLKSKDMSWEKGNFFTNKYSTEYSRLFFCPGM